MARCKLEKCPVARDGRCLEGLGPSCPNLLPEETDDSNAEVSPIDSSSPPVEPYHPLRSGLTLEVEEAREITRRGQAVVVTLVGLKESGKTCLIARLHQLFQHGPMGPFDFAGSRTLPHFEVINWKSTLASGLDKAQMDRTSARFDNQFVHFSVKNSKRGHRQDLLINDVSGETYKNAIGSKAVCESLVSIARADHLCIMIDGATLGSASGNAQVSKARDFIQRTIQNEQVGRWTALQFIFSKSDLTQGMEGEITDVVDQLAKAFGNKVGSVKHWCLAARPADHAALTISSIQEMFAYWLTITHRYQKSPLPMDRRQDWPRDFCRFGLQQ